MKDRSALLWSLVVAALVLGTGGAFIRLGVRSRAADETAHQKQTASSAALALERQLRSSLASAYPIADLLRRSDRTGNHAIPSDSAKSAGVDGWLTARNPGRLESLGVQLSAAAIERLKFDTRPAPSRGSAAVTGPYRTTDGRWAIVIPIPASPGVPDGSAVWVGAVVLVDTLLAATDVPRLPAAGFDFELSATDPVSGRRQTIARSSEVGMVSPAGETLHLADGDWSLVVAPRQAAWRSFGWIAAVVTILLTLGAGLVTYDAAGRIAGLHRELAKRDERLNNVNQRLMDEVQQRADIEQQFAHASFHDAVTGLPNRRYFTNRVNRALHRIRRQPGTSVAVLVLGLDRFKSVNETFGYEAGDDLLRQAARRLETSIQPADLALARIDGDEFAVMLQDLSDVDTAITVAERLQDALAPPFEIENEVIFATVSVGISVRSSGYAEAGDILGEADIALSRAKADGRARHALFDANAREEVVTLQQLETELHRAIEHDELRLFFQPIVSLETGRIAGMETLVRWDHPRQGIVSPDNFIRAAESLGLIVPINRWVLRRAAAQAREWLERLPASVEFYLTVNLSGLDLKEADLCDFVEGLVRETELPPGMLRLEVTESVLIEDLKGANDLVSGLRRIGVPLLLDDFGTGYSSLSYLDRFRVDYLKIDQAFIRRVTPAGPDHRILKAIIHLAEDLGMATIAEGVETADDVSLLVELGCDFAQGYYFSKPVPTAKAEALLTSGRFPMPDSQSDVPGRRGDRTRSATIASRD